jgi:LacI family transcriptional regulator
VEESQEKTLKKLDIEVFLLHNIVTGNVTDIVTEICSLEKGLTFMGPKKRVVTIHDVATRAGVSVSTVSRVLNGKVDVSSTTLERVQKVIEEMGYTSSLAARSMRTRRKNLIGLVVPDIGFPYAIEIMKGINQAIAESPFDLLVFTTGDIHKNGTASH